MSYDAGVWQYGTGVGDRGRSHVASKSREGPRHSSCTCVDGPCAAWVGGNAITAHIYAAPRLLIFCAISLALASLGKPSPPFFEWRSSPLACTQSTRARVSHDKVVSGCTVEGRVPSFGTRLLPLRRSCNCALLLVKNMHMTRTGTHTHTHAGAHRHAQTRTDKARAGTGRYRHTQTQTKQTRATHGTLQSAHTPPVGSQYSCQPTVKLLTLPLVWIFPLGKG